MTRGALRTAVLFAAYGVAGCSPNPSYFPYYLAGGPVIHTHAKPFSLKGDPDFDPHACRIEVQPVDSCGPVRTQHLLVATVYDGNNVARRRRRVEWILQGVGQIVEVDQSGILAGRGYKVDNSYAVTNTALCTSCVRWGDQDVTIHPGQTWCVINSVLEGTSAVTAYCPAIADPDRHKAFANRHWLDAKWQFPPATVCPAGSRPVLMTQITRPSDGQPLTSYRVRYRILDGADVTLLPGQGGEAIVPVDPAGRAVVAAGQLASRPGPRRVAIEVLRPDPGNPAGPGVVIGAGETTLEWRNTPVDVDIQVPPGAALNQELTVRINLHNPGSVPTTPVTVRHPVPDGVQLLRTDPPANLAGGQLVWPALTVPPDGRPTLVAVYRPARPGAVSLRAEACATDGPTVEAAATTQVGVGQLRLQVTGPAEAKIGDTVTYDVMLVNAGQSPVSDVTLRAEIDPGLDHESASRQLEIPVTVVNPGENKSVQLPLTVRAGGRLRTVITARGDGSPPTTEERFLTVQDVRLDVNLSGPTKLVVNQPATWTVRLTKAGSFAKRGLSVGVQVPPELTVGSVKAGQVANGVVTWDAAEGTEFQFTATPTAMVARTTLIASARCAGVPEVRSDLALEVIGVPLLKMTVETAETSVEVGRRIVYSVVVRNAGSLPLRSIDVAAAFPPALRAEFGTGPTMAQVEIAKVTFGRLAELLPGRTATFRVEAEALSPGDARVKFEARSVTTPQPVTFEEATRVVAKPR